MVRSRSTDKAAIEKLSGNVLGYSWKPKEDLLTVGFKFNISKRRKGKQLKPNLMVSDIGEFRKGSHNRHTLLSIWNGIYDPLGMATLYTIKLKLLMKETLNVTEAVDSQVSAHLIDDWCAAVLEGITAESLEFKHLRTSGSPVKLPRLVAFFDGSSQAYSVNVYIVWMCWKDPSNYTETLAVGDY